MMTKCSGCGANVSRHDSVCSCCGSNNPEARSIDRETVCILGSGQEAFQAADYEAAIQCFSDALDLDPEVFDAYFYLAESYRALNRHAEAIQATEKAQLVRSGSAAPFYYLGMLYQQIGRQAEAQKQLEKASALAETDRTIPDQKRTTARIFLRQGMDAFGHENYEMAIQYFSLVTSLAPDVFDAHFYMSASYSALNRPTEAVQAMEQAQQLHPGSAPLSYNLGMLYQQVGRQAEAQKRFEQALALAETDSGVTDKKQFKTNILLGQGMDAFRAENYEVAIRYFSQVIDLDSDVFDAHFYMAASYSTLNQPEEAIRAMEKAQRLRPGSASITYNLGMLYKQAGRKAEAQKYFEKTLALAETDSAVTDQKQFRQNVEKALSECKRRKLFGN